MVEENRRSKETMWMIAFFTLLIILFVNFSIDYLTTSIDYANSHMGNSSKSLVSSKTGISCSPCDFIISTPSWLINGKFVGSGYQENMTTEIMLENNITLIYRDGCGWCEKQLLLLDISKLNEEGLLIKC